MAYVSLPAMSMLNAKGLFDTYKSQKYIFISYFP